MRSSWRSTRTHTHIHSKQITVNKKKTNKNSSKQNWSNNKGTQEITCTESCVYDLPKKACNHSVEGGTYSIYDGPFQTISSLRHTCIASNSSDNNSTTQKTKTKQNISIISIISQHFFRCGPKARHKKG